MLVNARRMIAAFALLAPSLVELLEYNRLLPNVVECDISIIWMLFAAPNFTRVPPTT
jgi:hypothetical protein